MISEGWSRNWPNPTHRLDPPAVTPIPGTSTTTNSPRVTINNGTRTLRHFR